MDTVSSGKDLFWFFTQFWSTIVVALVIYGGGLTANQIVTTIWPQTGDLVSGKTKVMDSKLPLLFRLWYVTHLAHPFIVGAAISFIPALPHPDFVTSRTSGALWFGLAGMGNGTIHALVEALVGQVRKLVDLLVPWVRQKLGLPSRSSSVPTPPPANDPPPPAGATVIPISSANKAPSDPPPPAAA